jgi:beta-1,4-mannosyltransferase
MPNSLTNIGATGENLSRDIVTRGSLSSMREPPSRPVRLTFFPDYRAANPYQSLIYDRLGPTVEAHPGDIEDALTFGAGRRLFHLHWEDAVLRQPEASAERFLDRLTAFRSGGGRVIWTMHNLTSHDVGLRKAEADLQAGLADLADVIHLHSLPAVAAAMARGSLPLPKVRVIAHPSYAGAYPHVEGSAARMALGLRDSSMVALLPGRIAAYKQPAKAVAAFLDVAAPDHRLIVAGHVASDFGFDDPDDPRIVVRRGFADPAELARLHAAANFVVLPYETSLTSGSAILAATLGRGVLGPDLPGLRDAVAAGSTGMLYPEGELRSALAAALADGRETWAARGRAAAVLAAARAPDLLASSWRDLIEGVLQ